MVLVKRDGAGKTSYQAIFSTLTLFIPLPSIYCNSLFQTGTTHNDGDRCSNHPAQNLSYDCSMPPHSPMRETAQPPPPPPPPCQMCNVTAHSKLLSHTDMGHCSNKLESVITHRHGGSTLTKLESVITH